MEEENYRKRQEETIRGYYQRNTIKSISKLEEENQRKQSKDITMCKKFGRRKSEEATRGYHKKYVKKLEEENQRKKPEEAT